MPTLEQAIERVGTEAHFTTHNMHVKVIICGVKTAYGRVCYRVEPVCGHGSTWVDAGNLVYIPMRKGT